MDLHTEKLWWRQQYQVIGIDEVGRGCLAGPIVACAISFPPDHIQIPEVNDSKQLSFNKRAFLSHKIQASTELIGIGLVDAASIDRFGITYAVGQAMRDACNKISAQSKRVILVDGNQSFNLNTISDHVETIIRGDQLVYSIAAASIIAKVFRDNMMIKLHQEHPAYHWHQNKGYGTKVHFQAIQKNGLTLYHRHTFIH